MVDVLTKNKTPSALRRMLDWWAKQSKARPLRTMRAFAEQEIILPDGPFKGRRYNVSRQAWARWWFDTIGVSDCYQRFVLTGPSQSGKSLHGHIIPCLYHLFEHAETVALGLPDLSMANDKWRRDLFPAIEASRFREYLPTRGPGSRQGRILDAIEFTNGQELRFFTGGGGDKSRSAYTSRIMIITEVDGLDVVGGGSKEADKIAQLEARTAAYGKDKRIYLECTVSTDTGRITLERKAGTDSRIVCPCPHCGGWVTPEREHLIGWRDGTTENEAKTLARFACPECTHEITEDERGSMNANSQIIHRGQRIEMGWVLGEPEPTDTFSLRYSAFNNAFTHPGEIGKKEWAKVHGPATKEEEREKELRQFYWCIPVEQSKMPVIDLDAQAICRRTTNDPRGLIPAGTEFLGMGTDIGKWKIHWALTAFRNGATPHVVDYGVLEVPSRELGEERAILSTLRDLRDRLCVPGWPQEGGANRRPDRILVDCRYQGERSDVYPVYEFCAEPECTDWIFPSMGFGVGTFGQSGEYRAPATITSTVIWIGEHYHATRAIKGGRFQRILYVDVDHWKAWVHKRLSTPLGQPGSLTLYHAGPNDHTMIARHLTAERQEEEFVAGKGQQIRWVKLRGDNHLLDALTYSCVAGHLAGARMEIEPVREPVANTPQEKPDRERKHWVTPGGIGGGVQHTRRAGQWLRG